MKWSLVSAIFSLLNCASNFLPLRIAQVHHNFFLFYWMKKHVQSWILIFSYLYSIPIYGDNSPIISRKWNGQKGGRYQRKDRGKTQGHCTAKGHLVLRYWGGLCLAFLVGIITEFPLAAVGMPVEDCRSTCGGAPYLVAVVVSAAAAARWRGVGRRQWK